MINQKKVFLFLFITIGYSQYNSFKSKNKSPSLYMFYHPYNCLSNLRRNNNLLWEQYSKGLNDNVS